MPPEDSLDIARRVKEMYCYTCADIAKVISIFISSYEAIVIGILGSH